MDWVSVETKQLTVPFVDDWFVGRQVRQLLVGESVVNCLQLEES
jgi:hypothetical protein